MSGSLESLKRSVTVSQYYIPSQSSLRLSSTLGNVLDQQHSKDSDPVQRPWVASSQELWMVACFAVIAALVSLDAMMMVTILPVTYSSAFIYIRSGLLTRENRTYHIGTTQISQPRRCGR